jgi:hypothetical protein
MSQSDPNVANGDGGTVRTGIDNALKALQSANSDGSAFPSYAVYGTTCLRTDIPGAGIGTVHMYDGANWVALFQIDTTTHAIILDSGLTVSATQALSNNSKKLATTEYADRQVGQVVFTELNAVANGTTSIPYDDTIPQNTEGNQYVTLSITPKSATSKLLIEACMCFHGDAAENYTLALFQDSGADALAAVSFRSESTEGNAPVVIRHEMTSGTTAATTFKLRAGGNTSGSSLTLNGKSGSRRYGGVAASLFTIREIL